MTISTFIGFSSYTFGFNQKLSAHFKFARSLENPTGFNQALRNINTRLGGPEHFSFGVPERREELMSVALGPGVTALSKDTNVNGSTHEIAEPIEGWNASPSQDGLDQNQGEYHTSWIYASFPASGVYVRVGCQSTLHTPDPIDSLRLGVSGLV